MSDKNLIGQLLQPLTFKKSIPANTVYRTQEVKVNTFNSISVHIVSNESVKFQVFAGKFNEDVLTAVELFSKELEPDKLYSKRFESRSNQIFYVLTDHAQPANVFCETFGSFTATPSGSTELLLPTDETQTVIATKPMSNYETLVLRGAIGSESLIKILGISRNVSTSSRTVWDRSNLVYDSASGISDPLEIVSSDTNDDHEIRIYGLDNKLLYIEEDVVLTGLAPVALSKAFTRINKMEVITDGTNLTNLGTVDIRSIVAPTDIYESMAPNSNKSTTFHYTIGKNNKLILDKITLISTAQDNFNISLFKVTPENSQSQSGLAPGRRELLTENLALTSSYELPLKMEFQAGETITLEIQSLSSPLGENRVFASTSGILCSLDSL